MPNTKIWGRYQYIAMFSDIYNIIGDEKKNDTSMGRQSFAVYNGLQDLGSRLECQLKINLLAIERIGPNKDEVCKKREKKILKDILRY